MSKSYRNPFTWFVRISVNAIFDFLSPLKNSLKSALLPRLECFLFIGAISLHLFTELETCKTKHIYCNIYIFVKFFWSYAAFPTCFYLVVGWNQPLYINRIRVCCENEIFCPGQKLGEAFLSFFYLWKVVNCIQPIKFFAIKSDLQKVLIQHVCWISKFSAKHQLNRSKAN